LFGTARRPTYQEPKVIGYRVYTRATKRDPYAFDQAHAARERSSDQIRFRGHEYYNSLKGNDYYENKRRADRAARGWRDIGHSVRVVPVRSRGRR